MLNNEEDQKLIDGKSFGEAEALQTDSPDAKGSLDELGGERLNKSDSKELSKP